MNNAHMQVIDDGLQFVRIRRKLTHYDQIKLAAQYRRATLLFRDVWMPGGRIEPRHEACDESSIEDGCDDHSIVMRTSIDR